MIVSVRFPFAVHVVKLEGHIEWKPGKDGVRSIEWCERGLLFTMDEDGRKITVVPPPGSVIDEEYTAAPRPTAAGQANAHGPASSPPPARAIPAPSSRKGR